MIVETGCLFCMYQYSIVLVAQELCQDEVVQWPRQRFEVWEMFPKLEILPTMWHVAEKCDSGNFNLYEFHVHCYL